MGRVYYATQEPLGRAVALKVVRDDDEGAGEMRSRERFLLEAEILARLQHPNIVSLFDFGTMDGAFAGQSFIAMELVGGETLAQRLHGGKSLPSLQVLSIAGQIARGLRAAHDRGIVHRDLKPSNVMLVPDSDGEEIVKLVDFGIGKLLWDAKSGPGTDLTGVGGVVGTPQFMAPEQIEGRALAAADLYALGTIMFLALAGRLPFDGATTSDTLKSKISRVAPRLRDVAPTLDVSDELESLVASLLRREPEQRPTISALTRAIAACASPASHRGEPGAEVCPPSVRVDVGSGAGPATGASLLPPAAASAASSRPSAVVAQGRGNERMTRVANLTPIMVGALVTYAVVLVYVFGGRASDLHEPPRPVATAPATATAGATTLEGKSVGARPGGATSTVTLAVDSVPGGATVTENGRLLGTTPLVVTLGDASVGGKPRQFALSKSGYTPVTVEQGTSHEDTHMVVALARDAQVVALPRSLDAPVAAPRSAAAPAPMASAPPPRAAPAAPVVPAAPATPVTVVQEFSTGK